MLAIPGYRYDPATNRYYKESPAERRRKVAPETQRRGPRRNGGRRTIKGSDIALSTTQIAAARTLSRKFDGPATYDGFLGSFASSGIQDGIRFREQLRSKLHLASTSSYRYVTAREPDTLVGDAVTRFAIEAGGEDGPLLRYGTNTGLLGHGSLADPSTRPCYQHGFNTETWRLDRMCGSRITSLHVRNKRLLSICLKPRKTSIWTSALSDDGAHFSLGCDKKILVSDDAGQSEIQMLLYDTRFIRHTQANMSNGYQMTSEPIFRLSGHINSLSTNLGFDVCPNGRTLAVAGSDGRIRLWSLAHGKAILSEMDTLGDGSLAPGQGARLLDEVFETPPECLGFHHDEQTYKQSIWVADGSFVKQYAIK
ncbi:DDB1- and CUL4-associated factor 4 [Cystobasidiomycetes sp. EMM_F5]